MMCIRDIRETDIEIYLKAGLMNGILLGKLRISIARLIICLHFLNLEVDFMNMILFEELKI